MKNAAYRRRLSSLSAILFSVLFGIYLAKGNMALAMYCEACTIVFFILVILYCTVWKEK